jgi:hypothetical protein
MTMPRQAKTHSFHGVPCNGKCCTQNRHLGTCYHLHQCRHHEREDRVYKAREAKRGVIPDGLPTTMTRLKKW